MVSHNANEVSALADFADGTHVLTGFSAVSGDLVVALAFILDATVTFGTPTGANVTLQSAGSAATTGGTVQIWYGVPSGAVGNITFTTSAGSAEGARVWAISADTTTAWSSPLDQVATSTEDVAGTTHDPDISITTTGANTIIVGITGLTTSPGGLGAPTGYTAFTNLDAGTDLAAYRIETSTGTFTWSSTSNASATSATVLAAFKEDAVGGGGLGIPIAAHHYRQMGAE